MKYKVIFFDWDGTLSDSRFWECWKGTELDSKYSTVQRGLFSNKEVINGWMVGKMSSEEISKMVAEITKMDYDFVFNALIYSAKNMKVSKSIFEKIEVLKDNGIKTVIATDNMDTFTRWTAPALNLENTFDGILNSFDLGAKKFQKDGDGNSLFFSKYLLQNDIKPSESILIDNSEHVSIIKDFGMDYTKIENNNLSNCLDLMTKDM